jgi:hypothetical protein
MPDLPEMPRRLRQRAKHNGYPVPYSVMWVDGVPDFRVTDGERWLSCVRGRRCAMCGVGLDKGAWFVGGPLCEVNRVFLDPAMHLDCAEFALRVCPFLAAPRSHFSDLERRPAPDAATPSTIVSPERPDRFMLGLAAGYQLIRVNNQPAIYATPWHQVQWWRHGSPIT